jgi:tellurite resistance protein
MADREEGRRCVQLMVLAALADGHVEGTEAVAINKLVQSVPELAHAGHIGDIGRETRHMLDERGMDACLRDLAAGIASRPMRELAFQCCARVVGADSAYSAEEEDFLRKLQEVLGFSVDDMRRLLVLAAPGMSGGPPVR